MERISSVEAYKAVIEHFRQSLKEFFDRCHFFLVAESFFALAYSQEGLEKKIKIVFTVGGLILSLIWGIAAWSNWKWIKRWRREAIKLSLTISDIKAYARVETTLGWEYSWRPEKIVLSIPFLFAFFWGWLLFLCF